MKRLGLRDIVLNAAVAATYAVLTLFMAQFNLSYGAVQFRISEALCILPFFIPTTAWGLFVGCILANLFSFAGPLDIVFGSLATLAAGFCTSVIKIKWLAPLPPVAINGLVVGAVLAYLYTPGSFLSGFLLFGGQVFLGELAVLYAVGLPLIIYLPKSAAFKRLLAWR